MANSGSERRLSAKPQPAPTGDGTIVLGYVLARLRQIRHGVVTRRGSMPATITVSGVDALCEDLNARADAGRKKYGTMLRVNNGRNALVDLYQEITDAIMYAAQARMEGDDEIGKFAEPLIETGAQLAAILDRRSA